MSKQVNLRAEIRKETEKVGGFGDKSKITLQSDLGIAIVNNTIKSIMFDLVWKIRNNTGLQNGSYDELKNFIETTFPNTNIQIK